MDFMLIMLNDRGVDPKPEVMAEWASSPVGWPSGAS